MSSSSSSRSTVRVDEWSLPSYPPSGTRSRPTRTVVGCGSLVDPHGGRCSNTVVVSVIVVVIMAMMVITGVRIARMCRRGICAAVNHMTAFIGECSCVLSRRVASGRGSRPRTLGRETRDRISRLKIRGRLLLLRRRPRLLQHLACEAAAACVVPSVLFFG